MVNHQRVGRVDNLTVHHNMAPIAAIAGTRAPAGVIDVFAPDGVPFVFI
jgi:hypothetical protein